MEIQHPVHSRSDLCCWLKSFYAPHQEFLAHYLLLKVGKGQITSDTHCKYKQLYVKCCLTLLLLSSKLIYTVAATFSRLHPSGSFTGDLHQTSLDVRIHSPRSVSIALGGIYYQASNLLIFQVLRGDLQCLSNTNVLKLANSIIFVVYVLGISVYLALHNW